MAVQKSTDSSKFSKGVTAASNVTYTMFCRDLLEVFGIQTLQNHSLTSFTDTIRELFRQLTTKLEQGTNEVKIKDMNSSSKLRYCLPRMNSNLFAEQSMKSGNKQSTTRPLTVLNGKRKESLPA